MSTEGSVTIERRERVAVITLRRPERRNAMSQAMWDGLEAAATELRGDLTLRAVIITGEGPAFCAGHDVSPENPMTAAFFAAMRAGRRNEVEDIITRLKTIVQSVEDLEVPTIAALNGDAHGGGVEIALVCDLRVLDEGASLCMSEARIGLVPDMGGIARLSGLIGPARARDLVFTARDVRADEALAIGLANRVAPAGRSLEAALDLAALIAQNGPVAVRACKRAALAAAPLRSSLLAETEAAADCILSGECVEGITAFLSKRPASFKDPH